MASDADTPEATLAELAPATPAEERGWGLRRFTDRAELTRMAREEKSQPEVYLFYLLGWLVLLGLVVLGLFPRLENVAGVAIIGFMLVAYVVVKYYFGTKGIFTN